MASKRELEDLGFTVKSKPKVSTGKEPKQKPKIIERVVEKKVDRIVNQPVAENSGVLGEVVKTNQVMHDAIAKLTSTMEGLGYKPKSLKCDNIKRDTRGLMTSFEIKVLD